MSKAVTVPISLSVLFLHARLVQINLLQQVLARTCPHVDTGYMGLICLHNLSFAGTGLRANPMLPRRVRLYQQLLVHVQESSHHRHHRFLSPLRHAVQAKLHRPFSLLPEQAEKLSSAESHLLSPLRKAPLQLRLTVQFQCPSPFAVFQETHPEAFLCSHRQQSSLHAQCSYAF